MAVIGNSPTQQAFTAIVDYFNGNGSTTVFTLSRSVNNVQEVVVVIENVPQNPSTAYTISGNVITFTSAPPSGTNNIYVRYVSPIIQTIQPGQQTVGNAQMTAGAPYWDANGNVGVGTTSPSGASGKVLEINGAAGQARLALKNNVSGSSSTDGLQIVLDGSGDAYIEQRDNANLGFLTNAINRLNIDASGRVTAPYQPYFLAYRSTDQTGYNAADVGGDFAVLYNTTAVNTGNNFNTANGKFTAPVSGIYLFQASAYSAATVFSQNWLIVNGTRGNATDWVHAANNMTCGFDIVNLAAGDTVGYKAYAVSQTNVTIQANANHTYFKGYFLG